MTIYFDTSIVAKLYCVESDSQQTAQMVHQHEPPFPISHWQEIEIRNALRLKGFRKELAQTQIADALHLLQTDIENGVWNRPTYDLVDIFRMAEDLSKKHAMTTGCRTLDILHVATALVIGVTEFCSLDDRQRVLAGKAGLRVKP